MYLRLPDGTRHRVGKRTIFEIVLITTDCDAELRIRTPRGKFKHVSYHASKEKAEQKLAEIKAAINRGDNVFCV